MKPLSPFNFSRNNKKKLITSVIAVMTAVAFLYAMQAFVKSIYVTVYQLGVAPYKVHMQLLPTDSQKPIPANVIDTVKHSENVEKIIPFLTYGTRYSIPGTMTDTPILGLRDEDIDYVMKIRGAKLLDGRLPNGGTAEVALDYRVAKNKKVKLGDRIGNAINKLDYLKGEFEVVGIIESKDFLSILPYNTSSTLKLPEETQMYEMGILVFPAKNSLKELDNLMSSFPKEDVRAKYLSDNEIKLEKSMSVMQMLDLLTIISIVVMVISVGSSKYVQFFNRKSEFGLLNAIGYNKLQIMKKAFLEISFINFLGFTLGLIFGLVQCIAMNYLIFDAVGGIGVLWNPKGLLIALYIPLFTTLFTLIPVNRLINRLDPINMIEGVI